MKKEEHFLSEKVLTIFTLSFVALAILLSLSKITGFIVYPRGFGYGYIGRGMGEVFSVLDIYYQYPSWFDFFIFLLIFLGLGKGVFGEHFEKRGGKFVYTGLGVFLAIALLIWEQQTGTTLVELFGPWALIILVFVLAFYLFKWIKDATDSGLLAISLTIIFLYLFTTGIFDFFGYGALDWLFYSPYYYQYRWIFGLIFILAIVGAISAIWQLRKS